MSEYLPDGFFEEIGQGVAARPDSELIIARDMALERPGAWVRVGDVRRLTKPPSTWVTEVHQRKKKCLRVPGGGFTAVYWVEDEIPDANGMQLYGKAIKFIAARTS